MKLTDEQQTKVKRITTLLYGPDVELPDQCTDGGEHEMVVLTHADSRDSYVWISECKLCNAIDKTTTKRTGEDLSYWS